MNLTKVHLFVLLLLALVLCSFFGGACGGSLEGYANNSDQDQYASYADMYSGNNTDKNKGDRKDNANDKPVSSNSMNDRNDDDDDQMSTKYAPYYRKDKRGDGIPASQIPPGTEDLYILKSKVVPPVCPVCPSIKCDKNSNKDKNENSQQLGLISIAALNTKQQVSADPGWSLPWCADWPGSWSAGFHFHILSQLQRSLWICTLFTLLFSPPPKKKVSVSF